MKNNFNVRTEQCSVPTWTKEEIKNLREIFANMSNKEISLQLNKPINDIVSKAHSLHLYKTHEYKKRICTINGKCNLNQDKRKI